MGTTQEGLGRIGGKTAVLWICSLLTVVILVMFFWLVSFRYPTSDEIKERFGGTGMEILVDTEQSDKGYFGVVRLSSIGREEFSIETFPQWAWPWKSYDWKIDD